MPKVPPLTGSYFNLSGELLEKAIAAFLKTPLTEEQLKLIGEITTLWNSVHHRLQYFVWQVAGWVDGMGALVTTDLQAASMVTLGRNIVHNRMKNVFAKECADSTIDLFDVLRVLRNKIVHGLPTAPLDGTMRVRVVDRWLRPAPTVREFVDSTAKRGKGLKITTHRVSDEELKSLLDDIALLAVAVEGVINQNNMLTYGPPLEPDALRQVLEREMLTPISHVQARRDSLRRQLRSEDTPPPPLPPSGA